MRTIEPSYLCATCEEVHEEERAARFCCDPEEIYVCPVCEKTHWLEVNAKKCCPDDSDPDAIPMPTAAELEAAGQQRLFLIYR